MKPLLTVIFLCSSFFSHAQKFHFGIKANAAISDVSITMIKRARPYFNESTHSKVGFCGGLFAEVPLFKYASVQAEALYSNAGFRYNYLFGDERSYNYTINYWSFPFVVKARLKGFALVGGVQYSSLISAKKSPANNESKIMDDPDVKSSHQPEEWALVYGIEYTAPFGLGANIRYHYGLTSISKPSPPALSYQEQVYLVDDKIYNSIIQFGIYWRFLK